MSQEATEEREYIVDGRRILCPYPFDAGDTYYFRDTSTHSEMMRIPQRVIQKLGYIPSPPIARLIIEHARASGFTR